MDMRTLRFGIEVETVQRSREQVARAIQSVVGGEVQHIGYPASFDPWTVTDPRGRIWKVVADASLTSAPPNLRAEIVTPILHYEDMAEFQEVIRAVRRLGAKAPEQNGGIHVHVEGQPFDGAALARLTKLVYKQEAILLQALGVSPERLARYTRPISAEFISRLERAKPKTKDELNPLWYGYRNPSPARYDSSRYCLLNLNAIYTNQTVEFRAFQATLHSGKIRAYATLCLALAARALSARSASSRKRAYDPQSAKYDLRVFLISALKLNGEEFKNVRKHLLDNLPGDSAFKRGRPKKQAKQDGAFNPVTTTEAEAGDISRPEHFEGALA